MASVLAVPGKVVADVVTVWTWLNMEGLGERKRHASRGTVNGYNHKSSSLLYIYYITFAGLV